MSKPTFEERCLLAEQCLPDAPYRAMLKKLHVEMLEALADHIPDAGKMVGPEPVLFIHPSTLEMASTHVGAWKPGHELPGYIALYAAPPAQQEPVAQRELIKELADQYARECVEFAKAIPSGAHSMSPIAVKSGDSRLSLHTAIDAMTAAPQPAQQEPFGYWHEGAIEEESDFFLHSASGHVGCSECVALYAAPPAAQRQPLTEDELFDWWSSENGLEDCDMAKLADFRQVVRAIEAKQSAGAKP